MDFASFSLHGASAILALLSGLMLAHSFKFFFLNPSKGNSHYIFITAYI